MKIFKIVFYFILLSAITSSGQINPTVSSSTGNFSLTCTNPIITLSANSSFTAPVSYTWTNPQFSIVNGNSITATAPGIFSLAASSGTMLQTTTVSVIVNTVQPTVTLTAASGSITCNTPTILMSTVSNPTNVSYTWVEPGVGLGCTSATCIAAQAGTYSVTVKDVVNGCQKTATINIGSNRQYPTFSSIGLYTVACPNGTVTLEPSLATGTANISFQWKTPTGAVTSPTNNLSLMTNAPGEYTLIATNVMNGCATTTLVNVFACVGLNEIFQELKVIGYPNPANDKFVISTAVELDKITVVNCIGQEVFDLQKPQLKQEIDISHLPAGVYFAEALNKQFRCALKFIKQ